MWMLPTYILYLHSSRFPRVCVCECAWWGRGIPITEKLVSLSHTSPPWSCPQNVDFEILMQFFTIFAKTFPSISWPQLETPIYINSFITNGAIDHKSFTLTCGVGILSFMIDSETEMTGLGLPETFNGQNITLLYYEVMYGSDVIPDNRNLYVERE